LQVKKKKKTTNNSTNFSLQVESAAQEDIFDFDNAADELADIRGVPERLMKSDEDIAAVRDARAKAQQTQQMLSIAQQAGDAGQSLQAAQNPPQQAGR